MYASPAEEKEGRYQAKLIVNMVVAVFLIMGMLIMMQYFNFLYLRDIPVIGGWLMDVYEGIFGTPKVLILHGEDSIGDWSALKKELNSKMVFFAEEQDIDKFGSGMETLLARYGMIIVEDAKRMDKDKLVNLRDFVKNGGNLIWVGDAGTIGTVEYQGEVLATQTGWIRDVVCIDQNTKTQCDCKKAKGNTTCKYLPEASEQQVVDMTELLGVRFDKDVIGDMPEVEIVDSDHWSVMGIIRRFTLQKTNRISMVTNEYTTALVANINMGGKAYPAIVVNDQPGTWGNVVYFAYPPEETMEILLPLMERLRY